MKLTKKIKGITTTFMTAISLALPEIMVHAQGSEVEAKLKGALSTVQTILLSLVVTVGIVVSLFIIIKRMPSADNPQEKHEVYQAVGRVLGLVAIAAALVWLVPWVYSLFT